MRRHSDECSYFTVIIRLTLTGLVSLSKRLKKLSDAVTKSYQSLMDEYPITMDQLYEVSKESTGVYYTHIMQVLSMMGYTGTLCPKEGLHRLILQESRRTKLSMKKHPKFKIIFL